MPSSVAQVHAVLLVHAERLGLAAAPVQREHQLTARALGERVGRGDSFELPDELGVASEAQVGLDAFLDRDATELFEPQRFGAGEVGVGELGERGAPPEAERLVEERRGRRRLTGAGALLRVHDQPFELEGVELLGLDRQQVSGRRRQERRRGATVRLLCERARSGAARRRSAAQRRRPPAARRPTGCRRAGRPRRRRSRGPGARRAGTAAWRSRRGSAVPRRTLRADPGPGTPRPLTIASGNRSLRLTRIEYQLKARRQRAARALLHRASDSRCGGGAGTCTGSSFGSAS